LVARSDLTAEQVQTASLDILSALVGLLDRGAKFLIKLPNGYSGYLEIFIPGMTIDVAEFQPPPPRKRWWQHGPRQGS